MVDSSVSAPAPTMTGGVAFWTSPELVGANRLGMHSLTHHERVSLDGDWDFQLLSSPDAPAGDEWRPIEVPGCWTMQGVGDAPIYTNVKMPFPLSPPDVPAHNPTGLYEREVDVPEAWRRRRVVLHVGAADGALSVTVNGRTVGLSKDSHLASEFDVTAHVAPGTNRIALRVVRWSDASYIEDQDQWWQAGITRPVFLYATGPVYLADVRATGRLEADGAGTLEVEASVGGDPAPGTRVELRSPLLDAPLELEVPVEASGPPERRAVAGTVGVRLHLPPVPPWSAERPQLSELTVTLLAPHDGGSEPLERARLQVGFRRVEVVGTSLLINGAEVLIRGVNRHDFDQHRGAVTSEAGIRADLLAMKRFGFNAVRTSHYPNDPVLLELCDELGLYVIDEADIEGHAFYHRLPDDPRYLPAFVDRVSRMVLRDKNHPCVIAWSLGNETGYGANHRAAAAWVRAYDHHRPLHYEGAIRFDWTGGADSTDLVCPMYPSLESIVAHARSGQQNRPLIMCEYSHAMGNSNGGLADYWDAIETTDGLQGGFIWEWWDHGLVQTKDDGSTRWAYGGDFGERVHDGNFCIDGMVFPDRTPKPAMWEHRQLAAPVRVTSAGGEPGAPLEIENRQSFRDLSWLRADLELTVDGRVVRSWAADLPTLRPAERAAWPLEVSVPPGGSGEVWLTARFRTVADLAWAAAGEEICWAQVPLGSVPASPAVAPPDGGADPLTRRPRRAGPHVDDDGLLVDGLLTRPPVLCLWRAPTDNDRIGGIAARWHEWGVDDLSRVVRSVEGRGTGTVEVRADIRTAAGIIVAHRVVLSTGQLGVRLDEEVVVPAELADLARVGTVLETVAGLEELIWWGRGPHESYPDRKRGAAVGRWESTVTDQHVGYIKPQEEGGHADVRSVALRAADGRELSVRCGRPSQVSVSHFDAADLAAASHVDELRPRPGTVVHIDAAHRGLGTASCGPDTLDRYLVGPGTYTWSWELVTATMP